MAFDVYLFLLSFTISLSLYCIFIPLLRHYNIVQTERSEIIESHKRKNYTPIFGSIVFVLVPVVIYLIYFDLTINIISLLFVFISFFAIGLLDDKIISKTKNNTGISAKTRIILENLICIVYCFTLYYSDCDTTIYFKDYKLDLGYLYYLFVILMIISSSNSSNLTDGIDGLLGGVSVLGLLFVYIISSFKANYNTKALSILFIASILSYMCFNCRKAKIFMGDGGSLAIGALIGSLLIELKCEIMIFLIMVVSIIESISVIIQVLYFKLTKGKRILKMAPIHHHFEICGLSELHIDILFWLLTLVGIIIGILLYL